MNVFRLPLRLRAAFQSLLAAVTLLLGTSCLAAPIPVPNGDFSNPANNGTVGGGVIGGSGSAAIGSGPWQGTYAGIASLLAPPSLSIGSGRATIGGLAGVNVLGIVNNSGYFSQDFGIPLVANRHYVLQANVDTGMPLDLGIINDGNAGLGLTVGSTSLITTFDAIPNSVSLSLLSGTTYRLVLTLDTGPVVGAGNLGVRLFGRPQGLVTANLLTSVSYTNVSLTSSVLNPVAASIGPAGGTPQGATINSAFAAPLTVAVLDNEGDPVANATVTFNAPQFNASAQLSATTAHTDAIGHAQVTAVANAVAGGYTIGASVAGVPTPATFNLTNLAGVANSVASTLGTPQTASVNSPFPVPLTVLVLDAGNHPLGGLSVTFSAPSSGPSATFSSGASVTTSIAGVAQVNAVANTMAGSYTVTAHVNGSSATATFNLTNTGGPASLVLPARGTPQSAMVSTPFGTPLGVRVTDAYGNPSSGVSVLFTAPAVGPGATFPPVLITTTVITDAQGAAEVAATANALAGSYQITATSAGLLTPAVFNLTNTATAPPQGSGTSGNGQGANVNAAFQCRLQLKVTSNGTTPLPGVSIDFVAPANGPTAVLSNGVNSGNSVTTTTDANGLTSVTAAANNIAGTYAIAAGVSGSGNALTTYQLTNFAAGERLFADGFEATPALCPAH